MKYNIPAHIDMALELIENSGYEGFLVGGCVRDCIMGRSPGDYDLCTSAKPEAIKRIFRGYRTIDTGISHGTVAVIMDSNCLPVEITTFRVDGEYKDNRHPEEVSFTADIEKDLARRDFTVNAIAMDRRGNLTDAFSGRADIEKGIIRTVGNADRRFEEDALRIMRGLRFTSTLGFEISQETESAMRRKGKSVRNISAERVQTELVKLLKGKCAEKVLLKYGDVLESAIEGIRPCKFTGRVTDVALMLALVFPENTGKHLTALRFDNNTVRRTLVYERIIEEYRSEEERLEVFGDGKNKEPGKKEQIVIKRMMAKYGKSTVFEYMTYKHRGAVAAEIIDRGDCCSIKELAINGNDLLKDGGPGGKLIGETLEYLLNLVIEEKVENEKERLTGEAEKYWAEKQ